MKTFKTSLVLTTVSFLAVACGPRPQHPPATTSASPGAAQAATPAAAAAPPAPARVSGGGTSPAGSGRSAVPVPATAEPVAPAAAAPAPRVRLIVPAGTELPIELETTVSSDTSRVGDSVLAKLREDVALNGFTLDKGEEVRGRVTTVVPAKRVKGRARIVLSFDAVMEKGERLTIETVPLDFSAKSTSGRDKKVVAGSAVGGLILGALKDGKKGAAIGTAIGAAAGGGAVLIMKGDEVELPRGAKLTLEVK